jgi:hypothetical protein
MFLGISCSVSARGLARITEPRVKGIVALVRWDDLGSALLQSRPAWVGTTQMPSIIASAQAMCPSKPSDFAIAR